MSFLLVKQVRQLAETVARLEARLDAMMTKHENKNEVRADAARRGWESRRAKEKQTGGSANAN